jgi:uncharacterized membrane protein
MDEENWLIVKKTITYKFIGLIISYILVLIYYGGDMAVQFTMISTLVFTVYYMIFEKCWNKYAI